MYHLFFSKMMNLGPGKIEWGEEDVETRLAFVDRGGGANKNTQFWVTTCHNQCFNMASHHRIVDVVWYVSLAQDRLATKWHERFPQKALDLVRLNRLPVGARLVSTTSEVSTPTCKDTFVGFCWFELEPSEFCAWNYMQGVFFNIAFNWTKPKKTMLVTGLQEISVNYNWLRSLCEESPEKVSASALRLLPVS